MDPREYEIKVRKSIALDQMKPLTSEEIRLAQMDLVECLFKKHKADHLSGAKVIERILCDIVVNMGLEPEEVREFMMQFNSHIKLLLDGYYASIGKRL